jgi:transposase
LQGGIGLKKLFSVLHNCVCGIDVHQRNVVACLLQVDENGEYEDTIKTFSTMTSDLQKLSTWLQKEGCKKVAMESTGVYWIPVFNILEEGDFSITLSNARQIKNVPGKKTDPNDSRWISKLLAVGLVNGSFIPPKEIRELRTFTRYRDKLIGTRTSEKDRALNILESCNIKLASVASDVFGKSGTAMMKALIGNPEDLDIESTANLAQKTMRKKIPELMEALNGRMDKSHAKLLEMVLDHLVYINGQIVKVEAEIEEKCQPYQQEIELLDEIPGVSKTTAQSLIAEIGTDMSVFETPERLASWAGLSPGNNESAGKKKGTRIRPGNQYIKTKLCQCSLAAARTKNTYLAAKYYSIKGRRGAKKAIIATSRHIIVSAFHMIRDKQHYKELGGDYLLKLKSENIIKSMAGRLKSLGYEVVKAAG